MRGVEEKWWDRTKTNLSKAFKIWKIKISIGREESSINRISKLGIFDTKKKKICSKRGSRGVEEKWRDRTKTYLSKAFKIRKIQILIGREESGMDQIGKLGIFDQSNQA